MPRRRLGSGRTGAKRRRRARGAEGGRHGAARLKNHLTARPPRRRMDRRYMNNREMCICCFKPPRAGGDLAVHHISYFPEVCCYVHDWCHEDIHDTPSKHPYLIQYEEGDSVKFYEMRIMSTEPKGRGGRYRRGRGGRRRRDRRPDDEGQGRWRGRGGRDGGDGREQRRRRI